MKTHFFLNLFVKPKERAVKMSAKNQSHSPFKAVTWKGYSSHDDSEPEVNHLSHELPSIWFIPVPQESQKLILLPHA